METKHKYFQTIKPLNLKDKRGLGIGDIYPVMLTIGLVCILIAIILFVLGEFQGNIARRSVIVTNETGAWLNTTPYRVDSHVNCSFDTFAVIGMWNASTDTVIPVANYTVDADLGTIVNATTNPVFSTIPVNISYSHEYGGAGCEAVEDISEDIADFVPWIGIILLIVAAAIVIGILVRNLAGGSSRV